MAMTKYSDIEIQTAKNLIDKGYWWIIKNKSGMIFAYANKPSKDTSKFVLGGYICSAVVPIFESVKFGDDPVSLKSIVHPQTLDDAERKYLSAVIKPFRDRVKYIKKVFVNVECKSNYCILIHFNDASNDMEFPIFGEKDMYKGMKIYNKYTLEELGL